jgi:hypothetical protein
MGTAPLLMICISESGEIVHQLFIHGDEYKGQWVAVASQSSTVEECAAVFSKLFDTKKFVAGTVSVVMLTVRIAATKSLRFRHKLIINQWLFSSSMNLGILLSFKSSQCLVIAVMSRVDHVCCVLSKYNTLRRSINVKYGVNVFKA